MAEFEMAVMFFCSG